MYPGPSTEARTGYAQNTQDTYRIQYSEGYTKDTSGYSFIEPPLCFMETPPDPAKSVNYGSHITDRYRCRYRYRDRYRSPPGPALVPGTDGYTDLASAPSARATRRAHLRPRRASATIPRPLSAICTHPAAAPKTNHLFSPYLHTYVCAPGFFARRRCTVRAKARATPRPFMPCGALAQREPGTDHDQSRSALKIWCKTMEPLKNGARLR